MVKISTHHPHIRAFTDFTLHSRQISLTFQINTSCGKGTCFVIATEKGSVLVSAKHLFKNVKEGDFVYFSKSASAFGKFQIKRIWHAEKKVDLCIFTVGEFSTKKFTTTFGSGLLFGQALLFLGFPHGLESDYPSDHGYSSPLVKRAFYSGNITIDDTTFSVLDGINNPGFSGGPIFSQIDDMDKADCIGLCGMISGYRNESLSHSQVYKKDDNDEFVPIEGVYVKPNSGIIYTVGMGEILRLLGQVDSFHPFVE